MFIIIFFIEIISIFSNIFFFFNSVYIFIILVNKFKQEIEKINKIKAQDAEADFLKKIKQTTMPPSTPSSSSSAK